MRTRMLVTTRANLFFCLATISLICLTFLISYAEPRSVIGGDDDYALRKHEQDPHEIRFKRDLSDDDQVSAPADDRGRKTHHNKKKKHTATTARPGRDDNEPERQSATGEPDVGRRTRPESSKKPKNRSTTSKPNQPTTTTKKSKRRKTGSSTTTTTGVPTTGRMNESLSDASSSKAASTKKPLKISNGPLSHTVKEVENKLKLIEEERLQQQERTALDHLLAGVYDWARILKRTRGRSMNKIAAGEVLMMIDKVKRMLEKEDKPTQLIGLYKNFSKMETGRV